VAVPRCALFSLRRFQWPDIHTIGAESPAVGACREGTDMVREKSAGAVRGATQAAKPSAVVDTRAIYCGDNLDQLKKLPDGCVDQIY